MSDETKKTDSTAQAGSATGAVPDNKPTQTGSDSTGNTGFQARIDGLTAQLGRKDTKIQELEGKLNQVIEANKSEQQKLIDAAADERLDQFKKQEFEPLTAEAEQMSAALNEQVDKLRAKLPEGDQELFASLPLVEQFKAYQTLAAKLAGGQTASVGGGVNPPEQKPRQRIAGSEFREWQRLDMHNKKQREMYESSKEEMQAAYREQRIDWGR